MPNSVCEFSLHFAHDCRCRSNVNNCYDFDELLTSYIIFITPLFLTANKTARKLLLSANSKVAGHILNINRMYVIIIPPLFKISLFYDEQTKK